MFITKLNEEQLKEYKQHIYNCLLQACNPYSFSETFKHLTITPKEFKKLTLEMLDTLIDNW